MEQLVWRKGPNPAAGGAASGAGAGAGAAGPSGDDANNNHGARANGSSGGGAASAPASPSGGESNGNGGDGGDGESGVVRWSSYVWRRGSVPIRWGQTIKQSIGRVGTLHHVILLSKHIQLMTASIAHVTNLTPGSGNPIHRRRRDLHRQRESVPGHGAVLLQARQGVSPGRRRVGLALFTTLLLCVKTHSTDDSQYSPCKQSDTRE
jgi:hypothetical protein